MGNKVISSGIIKQGTNANKLGQDYEDKINNQFLTELSGDYQVKDTHFGYQIMKDNKVLYSNYPKKSLETFFLKQHGINRKAMNIKEKEPDDCFVSELTKTVYVIEIKHQDSKGSVDEKIDGAPTMLRRYQEVFNPIEYKVKLIYVLSSWFETNLDSITFKVLKENNINWYYDRLPPESIGLVSDLSKTIINRKKESGLW